MYIHKSTSLYHKIHNYEFKQYLNNDLTSKLTYPCHIQTPQQKYLTKFRLRQSHLKTLSIECY